MYAADGTTIPYRHKRLVQADCHPGVRLRHLGSDPAWRGLTPIQVTPIQVALRFVSVAAASTSSPESVSTTP